MRQGEGWRRVDREELGKWRGEEGRRGGGR